MKTHQPLLRVVLPVLLLAAITRPAAKAQWLYQDDFTTNPGTLDGRTTASGFGSWVNSDNALQTGGGLITVSTNLPFDYHSATFALPTLSGPDILTISITTRPAGSGFLGIGFTDYAGQYVINNGLSWLYINGVGTGAPGNVEIFRGMGSQDRVYNGTPAGFDASLATTYSFTYNPINKTMGLSATNGSSSVVFFSALDISGLPSSAFDNFALQFQGQNISNASTFSYVSGIRAQVLSLPYVITGAGNWSSTGSWSNGLLGTNGALINFSGAGGASANNQLGSVAGLAFGNGAGSYTVSGNALTLGSAGITNDSGNLQSVSNDLTLGASAFFSSTSGSLMVAGNTALGTNTLTFAATAAITNSGVISGSGQVVKAGSGTATLSASSSYSGTTILNAGTLRVDHNNALGTGALSIFGGTFASGSATARTITNAITMNGDVQFGDAAGTGALTLSNVDLGTATRTLTLSNSTTVAGVISNTGGLTKAGNGTLVLLGANSYTGGTTINAGTLQVGNSGTTGSLGGGNVVNNGNLSLSVSNTLTVTNAISGNGTLNSGSLTTVLSGSNSYSGLTTVSAGILRIDNGNALGSTAAGTVISNGGQLRLQGVTVGNEALTISGNGAASSSGALRAGTGANTYGGKVTLAADSRFFAGSGTSMTLDVASGDAIDLASFTLTVEGAGSHNVNDAIVGTGGVAKIGTGTMTLTASNSYSGATDIQGGRLTVSGNGRLGSGAISISTNTGTLALAVTGTNVMANNISGNGALLSTSGETRFTGAVTASGGLTVSNSTVRIGNGGTSGSYSGNTVLTNSSSLVFDRSDAYNQDGTISGNGSLAKAGAGTTTLTASNRFTGGTTLNAGTLRLDHASAAGTGTITQTGGSSTLEINTTGTVANAMDIYNIRTLQTVTLSGNKTLNNATYAVDAGTTTTESGALSGSGGITKQGTGTLVVTASNSFTGAVAVNAGLLNLNSATGGAAASASSVSVATNATLLVSVSNQVNDSAGVTLSGGTIQRASGVSEVFGSLNLTASSFLDFGGGAAGTITFSGIDYTPSALLALNIANFNQGSSLVFQTTNNLSMSGFTFSGTGGFGGSSFNGSTFTITAIPEPPAVAAAVGLCALFGWPVLRRRLGKRSV